MDSEKGQERPDRRDFLRRMGTAAAYSVPVFAAVGTAGAAAQVRRRGEMSTPEQIKRHWDEAARHLIEADRLGARYRFQDGDWDTIALAFRGVSAPIKRFPPDWCAIC